MTLIEPVRLYDGCQTKIRVVSPDDTPVEKLVIYVNGSGPNTYENKRSWIDGSTSAIFWPKKLSGIRRYFCWVGVREPS